MKEKVKTAKLIKDNLEDFNGHAALYKLSKPVFSESWDENEIPKEYDFVICSAADVMFSGCETYIFPASEKGNVLDWRELRGSQKGTLSHSVVLEEIGYTIEK